MKSFRIPLLLATILVTASVVGWHHAQAHGGEMAYEITNKSHDPVIVIQDSWVGSPICLKPGEKKSFHSREFSQQHVIRINQATKGLLWEEIHADNAPKNEGRSVWKGNWNWEVNDQNGLQRLSGW